MKNSLTKYGNEDFLSNSWLKNFFDLPINNVGTVLKTNIKKEGNNYLYEIDIPGYNKEDVSITFEEGYLIVEAKTNTEQINKDPTSSYIRQERYTGTCSRSFYVGEVDDSKINAKYDKGVLSISVPSDEKELANTSKKINIK